MLLQRSTQPTFYELPSHLLARAHGVDVRERELLILASARVLKQALE
jgi:hypothetical protein